MLLNRRLALNRYLTEIQSRACLSHRVRQVGCGLGKLSRHEVEYLKILLLLSQLRWSLHIGIGLWKALLILKHSRRDGRSIDQIWVHWNS